MRILIVFSIDRSSGGESVVPRFPPRSTPGAEAVRSSTTTRATATSELYTWKTLAHPHHRIITVIRTCRPINSTTAAQRSAAARGGLSTVNYPVTNDGPSTSGSGRFDTGK